MKLRKLNAVIVFAGIALCSAVCCARHEVKQADKASSEPVTSGSSGGQDDVGIISPAAGGLSPVTNSDAVTGSGGGGVQQVMKEKAHGIASNPPSSLNQGSDEGN